MTNPNGFFEVFFTAFLFVLFLVIFFNLVSRKNGNGNGRLMSEDFTWNPFPTKIEAIKPQSRCSELFKITEID